MIPLTLPHVVLTTTVSPLSCAIAVTPANNNIHKLITRLFIVSFFLGTKLRKVERNAKEKLDFLDHSQKPVLRKKTRKTLTCAAVLCEHSFKGVAQVLYKQVCQSLPATLEQPTA
jgi:hypothetical protein